MDNSAQPLFRQIAVLIEDAIIEGTLAEGAQAPSTNELAAFHSINPATARKGLTLLCLLYTSPSPRDGLLSRMPSSA